MDPSIQNDVSFVGFVGVYSTEVTSSICTLGLAAYYVQVLLVVCHLLYVLKEFGKIFTILKNTSSY